MSGWLAEYGGKLIGGFLALLASSVVVQVSPIKLNPWTWLAKKIGTAINGEVLEKVDHISVELAEHVKYDNERNAKRARVRILRFADEILQGELHSREHFDEVLEDITEYNRYCTKHPEFPNDKAVLSIAHIERTYRTRMERNDFL